MISHNDIGPRSFGTSRKLKKLIDAGEIHYGGNRKLKIYGLMSCASGRRMKWENRVFFADEADALSHGYRPCGHCMRSAYLRWKENSN